MSTLLDAQVARAKRPKEDRRFKIMCINHGLVIGLLCAIFLVLIVKA